MHMKRVPLHQESGDVYAQGEVYKLFLTYHYIKNPGMFTPVVRINIVHGHKYHYIKNPGMFTPRNRIYSLKGIVPLHQESGDVYAPVYPHEWREQHVPLHQESGDVYAHKKDKKRNIWYKYHYIKNPGMFTPWFFDVFEIHKSTITSRIRGCLRPMIEVL